MHFKQTLERKRGNDRIPDDILVRVRTEMEKMHIINPSESDIRKILRTLQLPLYYEKIPSILKFVGGANKLNIVTTEKTECPICFEEYIEMARLSCNHSFCVSCILKVKEDETIKCPLCRGIQKVMSDYNLTDEQIKVIMFEFERTHDTYKKGKNYEPFDYILKCIAKNNNICL